MRTVAHYLDYCAQSFGVADRNSLESQHLSLFKKYLFNVIQDWEMKGDMDYLKALGMYKTRAILGGTVTAQLGENTVVLSAASDFYAVGCDIQINDKVYIIQSMTDTTHFTIWPAFMDADTTSAQFQLRYNRFPVPPYFKKILNAKMLYLNSITDPFVIRERDFALLEKVNDQSWPYWFQIKYNSRVAGFSATGTTTGTALAVTSGAITAEMANMPIRFEGSEEIYYLSSVPTTTTAVLDRALPADVTTTVFYVLPEGSFFIELYPHPTESKQIIFDYLKTEENKISTTEILLAPTTVLEAGLDTHLGRFDESSAASKQVTLTLYEAKKDAAKMKVVTDYTPSLIFLNKRSSRSLGGLRGYPHSETDDYGRRRY